jgi:hypothetical protein
VAGPHHLAATRRDAAIHQKPVEGNALIAQWIALVDADDRRWQAFDILASGEAGPGERVACAKGLNAVSHGGTVVLEVEHDALVAEGAAWVSVLSTSVTKQTGDMVYSGARRRQFPGIWARTTMLYALERDWDRGPTSSVFIELSERGDVRSGPVP